MTVLFNDENVSNYNVSITKISGMFDLPARMPPTAYDWADVDGIEGFTLDSDIYYKQRVISVKCLMSVSSMSDFQYYLGLFKNSIYNQEVEISTDYGDFNCILKNGSEISFIGGQYSDEVNAEFTLKFNQIDFDFEDKPDSNPDITNSVYWIDSVDLSTLGIVVEQTSGFFDFTDMKKDNLTVYHKESENVNDRKSRKLTLKCTLIADNLADFKSKIEQFQALISGEGLRELMLPVEDLENTFKIYNTDGFTISTFIESSDSVTARFKVVFIEPDPQIESIQLYALQDTDGTFILDTNGYYIYIIGEYKNKNVYLYTDSEDGDVVYLFTDDELDSTSVDYNINAAPVYLYTDEEII